MQINVGCFYFIKDLFFDVIDDSELMQNKENGNKRRYLASDKLSKPPMDSGLSPNRIF